MMVRISLRNPEHLPSVIVVSLIVSSSIIRILDAVSESVKSTLNTTGVIGDIVWDIFHLLHLPASPSRSIIGEVLDTVDIVVYSLFSSVLVILESLFSAILVFVKSLLDSVFVFFEVFLCDLLARAVDRMGDE